MYVIIGAFALTIYKMFVVNDMAPFRFGSWNVVFPSGLYILVDMS